MSIFQLSVLLNILNSQTKEACTSSCSPHRRSSGDDNTAPGSCDSVPKRLTKETVRGNTAARDHFRAPGPSYGEGRRSEARLSELNDTEAAVRGMSCAGFVVPEQTSVQPGLGLNYVIMMRRRRILEPG